MARCPLSRARRAQRVLARDVQKATLDEQIASEASTPGALTRVQTDAPAVRAALSLTADGFATVKLDVADGARRSPRTLVRVLLMLGRCWYMFGALAG